MESTQSTIDMAKLSDHDKAELRQFLSNEQQRHLLHQRELALNGPRSEMVLGFFILELNSVFVLETHTFTEMCWKKCITGAVRGAKLDKTEEGCMANCVERFLDLNLVTIKHLGNQWR